MVVGLLAEMACWLALNSVHCYDNILMIIIMMIISMHSHSSRITSNLCKMQTSSIHA